MNIFKVIRLNVEIYKFFFLFDITKIHFKKIIHFYFQLIKGMHCIYSHIYIFFNIIKITQNPLCTSSLKKKIESEPLNTY